MMAQTLAGLRCCLLAAIIAFEFVPKSAQSATNYPVRPIRIIAPFAAGGGVDVISRLLAERMSHDLHQEIIVLNRPGATGNIGTELAAKAEPDGYTLLMGNEATNAIAKSVFRNLDYDPIVDFTPISLIARVPEVLVVKPSLPAKTIAELIALAKAKPGQFTYGSAGIGSPPHLAAALFALDAAIDIRNIPYKGSAPALADLIGGRIDMYFSNIISAMSFIRNEQLRALAVTGAERSTVAPDIPTIAESLPAYEEYNWYGLFAPKGTPQQIIDQLHDEVVKALADKAVAATLKQQGAQIIGDSPEEFATFVHKEADKYGAVVRKANISIKN